MNLLSNLKTSNVLWQLFTHRASDSPKTQVKFEHLKLLVLFYTSQISLISPFLWADFYFMKARFKTFREFLNDIVMSHTEKGFKIICKKYLVTEGKIKPWNTPKTRTTFLAKLYIKEVLLKHDMKKGIARIEGYELLGKRCMYNDNLCVVVDAADLVDTSTGEMTKQLTIVNSGTAHWLRSQPFKVLINQVQI